MNIDDGKRENHLLEVDLIHGAQPLNEMGRRIDMRSPLSDMCENLRKESSAHWCRGASHTNNLFSAFHQENPGHRGMPGPNSCVRSTYFFEISVC